jgi:hypothetical protein
MIGRLIWSTALAALALIVTFAQLDRAARSEPALARLVPAQFSGFAAERLAEQALAREDAAEAHLQAVALVRRRPIPAEHLRLLAQAATLAGDSPHALAALEAATTRGWRDPVTQLAAAQSALAQGRHDAAAQRLAAVFARGAAQDQALPLLAALLAEPGGRTAFAMQLATSARWPGNILPVASGAVPPADFAPTIALALNRGAILPCDRLGRIADGYARSGHAAEAAIFWPGACDQS